MVNSNRKMTAFFLFKIAVRCFFFFFLALCDWSSFLETEKIIIISKRIDIHCNSPKKKLLSSAIAFAAASKLRESALNLARVQCPLVSVCAKFSTRIKNIEVFASVYAMVMRVCCVLVAVPVCQCKALSFVTSSSSSSSFFHYVH